MVEITAGGDAAEAGDVGTLSRRQVAPGLVQDARDEVECRPRQAFGKCFAAALPQDGVEGVDRVLVRLRELFQSLVHRGVTLQLLLKGGKSKRLDQVVD